MRRTPGIVKKSRAMQNFGEAVEWRCCLEIASELSLRLSGPEIFSLQASPKTKISLLKFFCTEARQSNFKGGSPAAARMPYKIKVCSPGIIFFCGLVGFGSRGLRAEAS